MKLLCLLTGHRWDKWIIMGDERIRTCWRCGKWEAHKLSKEWKDMDSPVRRRLERIINRGD